MERQEGYYWVIANEHFPPQVALFFGGDSWLLVGNEDSVEPQDLFWKDKPENKLTPPNI